MKIIAASISALTIYCLLVTYIGWNAFLWLSSFVEGLDPVLFFAAWFLWAFSFLIGRLGHKWLAFTVAGSYWFAFFEYALLLFPIANLAVLFIGGEEAMQMIGAVVACIMLALFAVGTFLAYSPVVRELDIVIDRPMNEPLHLVVASDFHLGILSGKRHLQRFVDKANELEPEAILLAGDLVDDDPVWYGRYGMSEVMEKLQAPLGVYGIVGNHEYYGKKIPLLVYMMKGSGVDVLLDETKSIGERFYLTGREDRTNRKRQSLEMLKPLTDLPWIVLDHTPSNLKVPVELEADLHISGHTHKGQMWPNRFITKKVFELDYGHRKTGKTHLLVSSGFGFWGPPIRIGSRAELWSIRVTGKTPD